MSSQPISPFVLSQTANNPFSMAMAPLNKSASTTTPQPTQSVVSTTGVKGVSRNTASKRDNPFLSALDTDSNAYQSTYGVNRPLREPMFLGYHNERPIYGGQRLFVLY